MGPTERWSLGFVHDTLANGRPFRILAIANHRSCHSPVLEAGVRMSNEKVGQFHRSIFMTRKARGSGARTKIQSACCVSIFRKAIPVTPVPSRVGQIRVTLEPTSTEDIGVSDAGGYTGGSCCKHCLNSPVLMSSTSGGICECRGLLSTCIKK